MGKRRKVRRVLLDAARTAIRRLVEAPKPTFAPGDRCKIRYSLVADSGGTLLRGALVEMTGVQDPTGRHQLKVVEIPDYQWTETNRLPYGPGFVLFVAEDALQRVE